MRQLSKSGLATAAVAEVAEWSLGWVGASLAMLGDRALQVGCT